MTQVERRASASRASVSATPLALALLIAGCASAALHATGRSPFLAAAAGTPVVLIGPGLALVARWSAVEPSPWKLGLVAWILSPPAFAALWGVARAILGPEWAAPAALALVGLAQVAAIGVRLGAEPGGRALGVSAALGASLAAGVLATYALAPVLALWGDGLWWAGAAAELLAPGPLEDPWLAGTPLRQALGPALLLTSLSQALALEPVAALGLLAAWPLAALPLALHFVAAPLWREPRRVLTGVALALVGGAAGAGLWSLLRGGPSRPVDGFGPFARSLAASPHDGPQGLVLAPLGPAWIPGAASAAWAVAALGLLCGVHALRHGRRPWVGLTGLSLGVLLALDPALGLALTGALLATAVAAPGAAGVRRRVLPVLVAWAALGLLGQRGVVWRGAEWEALGSPDAGLLGAGLGLLAMAALPLAWRTRGAGAPIAGEATIRVLLVASAIGGWAIAWLGDRLGGGTGSAALLSQMALGVLAGGGLCDALLRRGWARRSAVLLALALTLGLGVSAARLVRALAQAGSLEATATLETESLEAPPGGGAQGRLWSEGERPADPAAWARDRALAWRRLAERAASIEPRPVLILGESQALQRLRHAPAPHPAPLRAGIPLWTDRSVPHTREHPRHEPRVRAVRELYEQRLSLGLELLAELSELDRSALLWVDPADRLRSPDLEQRLHRLGFRPWMQVGEVTLQRWTPPAALAEGRAR